MRTVHVCVSCGFVSTLGSEFVGHLGLKVCGGCKADYGRDAEVTRWVDEKRREMPCAEGNRAEAQLEQGG